MIKLENLNVQMEGNAVDAIKEICIAIASMRFRVMENATELGISEEETDSEYKMAVLGGIANALSDGEDGLISEDQVAEKLFEIAERAYANKKKVIN